jgi:hypothetical protein
MSGYAQWSPFTTYAVNDIVFFDGLIYISIQTNNTNHQPNSSPTWWASNGGGSTITSISAGAGIAVSGSTAITITNTGVRTLASGGTGITIGGTTTDRTVSNTGVLTLTAGTNCSLGGTAQNPIVNAIATSTNPVRNTSVKSLIYQSPSPNLVLNNFAPGNPQNLFEITLPSQYTGCSNFTFYIRNIEVQCSTDFGGSPVFFQIYPSTTSGAFWASTDGAMGYTALSIGTSTPTFVSAPNTIWNWCPIGGLVGNKIYINIESTSSTTPNSTTTIYVVGIYYDVVGTFATLTT